MKTSLSLRAVAFVCAAAPWLAAAEPDDRSRLNREEGAVYLEDFAEDTLELKVVQPAKAFYTLEGKRYLGTMKAGQTVEVLAISDRAYRVRGQAQQGQVAGWVGPKFLEPLGEEFLRNLKKAAERKKVVDELIAARQVALGMTLEEVQQALGKPSRKTSQVDAEGRKDVYEYITYKNVPQYSYQRDAYGRLYRNVYFVKVETGKVSVQFADEVVTSISESEEDPRAAGIKVVPAPVVLF